MVEDGRFTWALPFWEQPRWRWDAMITAGVRAAFVASQLAAPFMVKAGRGLIVNISADRRSSQPISRGGMASPTSTTSRHDR